MSKSIFAACEAPAPASRQTSLSVVTNRLRIAGRKLSAVAGQRCQHRLPACFPAKAEMFN